MLGFLIPRVSYALAEMLRAHKPAALISVRIPAGQERDESIESTLTAALVEVLLTPCCLGFRSKPQSPLKTAVE